jgi:hypothetical protein
MPPEMGLLAQQARRGWLVPLVMQQRSSSGTSAHSKIIDSATLYLCRQGPRWVVVIESPGVSGAVPLRGAGNDTHDARFDLLARARDACPDATIMSADGALTSEDYEWRIEVRGVEERSGDLGIALFRELGSDSTDKVPETRLVVGGRCHWGMSAPSTGRPRTF